VTSGERRECRTLAYLSVRGIGDEVGEEVLLLSRKTRELTSEFQLLTDVVIGTVL
jgi:hypothetical protein